jgi:tetratricopeptide (TPR) repeat protein
MSIEIDGRAGDTVSDVAIIPPGKDRAETRVLKKGTTIVQGAEIVVPRGTVLILESANGNQVQLQPGSRFKVNVAGGEGETYTVLLGQALFKVRKALNFFNVNYQSFIAIVQGTEFDMAVEPEKEIRFRLTEGRLVVQREVKVKILDGDKVAQLTASDILAKGKKTEVSYRLGVEEYLKEFKTFRDAEDYFRQQLQEDEKSGEYERIQRGLNDLGHILLTVGRPREATGYFERLLKAAGERREEAWKALGLNNLGCAYRDLGEYGNAIGYHEESLALILKLYPDGVHPAVAGNYNNLASAYSGLGDWVRPIEYFKKALAVQLKLYPNGVHPAIAMSYSNLGAAHIKLGNVAHSLGSYISAIGYLEKALALQLKLYPDEMHPAIAMSYNNLGAAYAGLRDYRQTIEYLEQALALRLKLYPDGVHPDILQSYRNLSIVYQATGEPARAADYSKKADDIEAKLKK